MEKKTTRNIILLSVFALITVAMLISLAFSGTIEKKLGLGRASSGIITKCTFKYDVIDVGQGAASLLTMENGEHILIDAGTNKSEGALVSYLNKLKINTIDCFVLTHSDNDHTGGADAIYENFEVVKTYRPYILAEKDDYQDPLISHKTEDTTVVSSTDWAKCVQLMYSETYTKNGEQQESTVEIISDMCLPIISGGSSLRFFWPTAVGSYISEQVPGCNKTVGYQTEHCTSINNYSPIMLINYYNTSLVVTGDADESVEKKVVQNLEASDQIDLISKVDIYVAGHHGSNSSSCSVFLNVLVPKTIVVQCGNSKSHPHSKFLERIESVWQNNMVSGTLYRTDKNKDITFKFDGTDTNDIKMQTQYSGTAAKYDLKWWQIVLATISVFAVLLVVPIVPKRRRFRR